MGKRMAERGRVSVYRASVNTIERDAEASLGIDA
jgi:hypothetical protein